MSAEYEYEVPRENSYTIYSKSGCNYCVKAKQLLVETGKNVDIVECDDYLLENKEAFLAFIQNLAGGKEHRTFPIVFYNSDYIGGYTELAKFVEKDIDFLSTF
jgi:glutaredoxin